MTFARMARLVFIAFTLIGPVTSAAKQRASAQPPQKLKHVEPSYPREALRRGDEGMVIIEANIEATGHVGNARILWSGCDRFNESALKAIREWRYEVLRLNGKPTPWVMTVRLPFRLPERLKSRAGQPGACKWTEGPRPIH